MKNKHNEYTQVTYAHPTLAEMVQKYSAILDEEGVVVIPDIYTKDQIQSFYEAHDNIFKDVLKLIKNTAYIEKDLITVYEKIHRPKKKHWETKEGYTVVELAPGRYDFDVNMDKGIFASDEFLHPPLIKALMQKKLKRDYEHSSGALPAIGSCGDGPWHRDTYNISDKGDDEHYNDDIETKKIPPFYYTMLIPLVNLTPENGATVFIPKSHKLSYNEAKDLPHCQLDVEAGSVILFDGRIFHFGPANKVESGETRVVLYQYYRKKWYKEFT